MTSSAIASSRRFFGIDLGQFAAQARRAGELMGRSRAARALIPSMVVRLQRRDGTAAHWLARGDRFEALTGALPHGASVFPAMELPEHMFLHRHLLLPGLSEQDLAAAVQLEVEAINPFGSELLWGYATRFDDVRGVVHVDAVLASRRQVNEWYGQQSAAHPAADGQPEVWAVAGLARPLRLQGFGTNRRTVLAAQRHRLNLALLALAGLLLVLLLLSPTLQARARAIAAGTAFERLHQQAAPAVALRDQIVRDGEKAASLERYAASRAEPVKVLEAVTRALPDDTWLVTFRTDGLTAQLVGYTPNAAALLRTLEQMPGAREVKATAAATRRPGHSKESFSIEVKLDPAVYGRLPPSTGASA